MNNIKLISGCMSLILSGILISFYVAQYESDWILLAGVLVFSIIFMKGFRNDEIEKMIYNRVKNHISVLAIVLFFISLLLLPDSFGVELGKKWQGIACFVSYLSWFVGLYLLSINSEFKNRGR